MSNSDKTLQLAQTRGKDKQLPYAGAMTPKEAFQVLQADSTAILVDVRTEAELELVGRIPKALNIQWAFYPGMVNNAQFIQQLQSQVNKNQIIIFMCRTGGRSHNAAVAAQQVGYKNAYNMLEGFEGEANSQKQRTLINGWKQAQLPWHH